MDIVYISYINMFSCILSGNIIANHIFIVLVSFYSVNFALNSPRDQMAYSFRVCYKSVWSIHLRVIWSKSIVVHTLCVKLYANIHLHYFSFMHLKICCMRVIWADPSTLLNFIHHFTVLICLVSLFSILECKFIMIIYEYVWKLLC